MKVVPLQREVGRKIRRVVLLASADDDFVDEGTIGKSASRLKRDVKNRKKKWDEKFLLRRKSTKTKAAHHKKSEEKKRRREGESQEETAKEGTLKKRLEKARQRSTDNYNTTVALEKKLQRREKWLLQLPKGRSRLALGQRINQNRETVKRLKANVRCLEKEVTSANAEKEVAATCCEQLKRSAEFYKQENRKVKEESKQLEYTVTYLEDLLADNDKSMYVDGARRISPEGVFAVMDLLDSGVASEKVKPVVECIGDFCGVKITDIPSTFAINDIRKRQLALAQANIKEIAEARNTTIYTDETRRGGKSLMAYAISTGTDMKLVGVKELPSKSAQDTLDGLVHCLAQVSTSVGEPAIGEKLIVALKNTQSDQASTEKLFNSLLQHYRFGLLPKIMENWEELSTEEKDQYGTIHHFFCGLHLLIAFAETFNKVVVDHEKKTQKVVGAAQGSAELTKFVRKTECAPIRFVRTVARLFAPGSEDKFGIHSAFERHLRITKCEVVNKLLDFRRTRFNVVFLDGKYTFCLSNFIKAFIEDFGVPHTLLQAVQEDVKSTWCLAGARALGLLEMTVTAPLWNVLEDRSIPISDMEVYYGALAVFFAEVRADDNLQAFIHGRFVPDVFSSKIVRDEYFKTLTSASPELDEETVEILMEVFEALEGSIRHLAAAHIDDGEHTSMSEQKKDETASVRKHNKVCEEIFGHYDRMMRVMPNATPLTIEAALMYKKNGVGTWLKDMEKETRYYWIEESRSMSKVIMQEEKARDETIEKVKAQKLQDKIESEKRRKERLFVKKSKVMSDMVFYGLWQSKAQVLAEVAACKTKRLKVDSLKAQLRFRKEVLRQPADSSLYQFSKGNHQYAPAELTANLLILVEEAIKVSAGDQSFLVGLHVRHRFDEEEGLRWYKGRVVSAVPGYCTWFNIKYENDEAIYTHQLLQDLEDGDLEILPKQPSMESICSTSAEFAASDSDEDSN